MESAEEIDSRAARRENKVTEKLEDVERKREIVQGLPRLEQSLREAIADHSKKGDALLKSSA
jgi:hypothetical protein